MGNRHQCLGSSRMLLPGILPYYMVQDRLSVNMFPTLPLRPVLQWPDLRLCLSEYFSNRQNCCTRMPSQYVKSRFHGMDGGHLKHGCLLIVPEATRMPGNIAGVYNPEDGSVPDAGMISSSCRASPTGYRYRRNTIIIWHEFCSSIVTFFTLFHLAGPELPLCN